MILSTTQGLGKGIDLAVFMYMKDVLLVPSENIVSFFAIVSFVMAFKPILGYLVDLLTTKIRKLKYSVYFSLSVRYFIGCQVFREFVTFVRIKEHLTDNLREYELL